MDERKMWQWWTLISEAERRDVVAGIHSCTEYGSVVSENRMPDAGKLAVRDAYARHLKLVADLEAAHPEQ